METRTKTAVPVQVRPMVEDDIPSIMEIDRKLTGKERLLTYRDLVETYIGGDLGLSCAAEANGKVVGLILGRVAYSEPPVVESGRIQIMGVYPEYAHKGIGTMLVKAFVEQCRKKGLKLVNVAVSLRDTPLQAFLHRLGFAQTEMVYFEKKLSS